MVKTFMAKYFIYMYRSCFIVLLNKKMACTVVNDVPTNISSVADQ